MEEFKLPELITPAEPPSGVDYIQVGVQAVQIGKTERLHKLARTAMRSWAAGQLKRQDGLCAICQKPLDITIKGEGVIDHDHDTGEIRGVLHRSCNAAEGKAANAVGAWGAKSMKYTDIVPYLELLVAYLKRPGTGFMYPMHKTPDEKKSATQLRAQKKRAEVKAKQAFLKQQKEKS